MRIHAIILCLAACTIATEGLSRSSSYTTNTGHVCTSRECTDVAFELSKNVDFTVDPCNDFYAFACGGFIKSQPDDKNSNYNDIVNDKIQADIRQLMEADIEPTEPRVFKLVKNFYKSCVNTDAIETKGLMPFRQYLRDLGGWPVVEGDSWNGEKFDWRRPFHKFRGDEDDPAWSSEDRLGYLIHFRVPNYGSSDDISSMQVARGAAWTRERNGFNDRRSLLNMYYKSLMDIAEMLGADKNRTRVELRRVLMLEWQLAKIKRLVRMPFHLTIRELTARFPSVPWMTYIRNFVPSSRKLTGNEMVEIYDPYYYVRLEAIMARTPKRVQVNYVMSKIAVRNAVYSTGKMRTTVNHILGETYSVEGDRRTYCDTETMKYLWRAVTAMYAAKYYSKDMKLEITSIASRIQMQLERHLRMRYWPRAAALGRALDVAEQLNTVIGYPDKLVDLAILEELYINLAFTEADYFENMSNLSNYDRELSIKEITQPYADWTLNNLNFLSGAGVGGTKSFLGSRTITIAAENFRDLYFGIGRPRYMNYGTLGRIIGHEMIHSLYENSWRGTYLLPFTGLRMRPEFRGHAQCLTDQYNNFHVDNMGTKLDGARTLAENIADVGGMRLAYDAYKNLSIGTPEESKLPGFEQYSAKQMFWISFGSSMCEKIQPEDIPRMISDYGEHTIYKFRMIGSLANMPEFAEDFHCTAPSLVNPIKRCDIW